MKYLTYESCGVLGGRVTFPSGAEYVLLGKSTPKDLAVSLLYRMRQECEERKVGFQFQRLAVVFVLADGMILYTYTTEEDYEERSYSCQEEYLEEGGAGLATIRDFLWVYGIQEYNILQQTSPFVFRVLDRTIPPDQKKGNGKAFERFRCLDMFGPCNLTLVEQEVSFHDYERYALGEGFFLEAFDNYDTGDREFWIGRAYLPEKYRVAAYAMEEMDYTGFLDEVGRLMIDQRIASMIAALSNKHEFFCIDNDYNLRMHAYDLGDGFFDG